MALVAHKRTLEERIILLEKEITDMRSTNNRLLDADTSANRELQLLQ